MGRYGPLLASNLYGQTGTVAPCQVDDEVFLGTVFAIGTYRYADWLPMYRGGKVIVGAAVSLGGIAHGCNHRRSGPDLALRYQLECVQPWPGSTSTAVINLLSVSIASAALCPSNPRRFLWPWRISGLHTDTRCGPGSFPLGELPQLHLEGRQHRSARLGPEAAIPQSQLSPASPC